MIRQLIPFLFAFVVIAVQAEPLRRRRRQATTNGGSSIAVPCPVRCSWGVSQAWSKAISFDTPSVNMVSDHVLGGANDTFNIMCSLYGQQRTCLRTCVAQNSGDQAALDAAPAFEQVCINRQADFDASLPCLSNNTKLFQSVCQRENENLLAASVRLSAQKQLDAKIPGEFCAAANKQLFCVFPIVRQTCGDSPYDLIRSIVNASLASVRAVVGEQPIHDLFPDCGVYFDTVSNGIPAASDNGASTSPVGSKSTIAYTTIASIISGNSTIFDNTTTSDSIRRDDAGGQGGKPERGRLDGTASPRFRTTTPSDAPTIKLNNFLALFTTAMLFCIFL